MIYNTQIEDYFKFRAYQESGFIRILVCYSWYGIHKSYTIGTDSRNVLKEKLKNLFTDKFFAIYERNRFEAGEGVFWSWVTTNGKTYLFREPSLKRLEMAILNIKIFDLRKHSEYLKSEQFENMLAEHSKKTHVAFSFKVELMSGETLYNVDKKRNLWSILLC
ncbi:MAG TPA: hypothetical protein VK483_01395 [Chitinophagaceae bacterium]|nr:hypothetical protein [Chitinophagaceae bacterium]